MNNNDIPVWEKYTLTIEEASKYFRIGENKDVYKRQIYTQRNIVLMTGNVLKPTSFYQYHIKTVSYAHLRKRGERTGLDTLVVHAVNDEC